MYLSRVTLLAREAGGRPWALWVWPVAVVGLCAVGAGRRLVRGSMGVGPLCIGGWGVPRACVWGR